ncbi:hypothetical protein [Thorsellia kenyensis]|uniref:Uncharacterized protein n=1 Tax=Thorsellia kenyensis TaxID=1549888 RepID=A0ABV6CGG2_9GAMM
MKKILNLLLLIISFNVFSSDIFGLIVNDGESSYFYSDVPILNQGQIIYYQEKKKPCCNQFTIEEDQKGILTEEIISDNKETMDYNEKIYRFNIKKEMEHNSVFLAWSSPSFASFENNVIYINNSLIYSLCLTPDGISVELQENKETLKSFYYYLGYDIDQNCYPEEQGIGNGTQNNASARMINQLKKSSVKLKQNKTDWVYENLFIEYLTYKKTGDGNYKQLKDTEKDNAFFDWIVASIYFVLANIELDENDNLIKNCIKLKAERFMTSRTFGNVVNYNSYCIDSISLANEQLIINFYLKNDTTIYPEKYALYLKYKPIDDSVRLYRVAIEL